MKLITIGRVVAAHGIRGDVKFRYYNEAEQGSLRYRSFFVVDDSGKQIELVASRTQRHRNLFLIKFEGMEIAEDIQFLLGKELSVREEELAPLSEDEYYDYQLVGLQVSTDADRPVGTVKEIMHTGAHDILVIQDQTEVLIPMTGEHIVDIDVDRGTIRIKEEALAE